MTAFDKAWGVVKQDFPDEQMYLSACEEVRDLVQQGMPVMPAVKEVSRLLGLNGRTLMRIYTKIPW